MEIEVFGFATLALGALLGFIAYRYDQNIQTDPEGKIDLRFVTLTPHYEALWFTAKIIMIGGIATIAIGVIILTF